MNSDDKGMYVQAGLYVVLAIIVFVILKKMIGLVSGEKPSAQTASMLKSGAVPSISAMNKKLILAYLKEIGISNVSGISTTTALSLARGQGSTNNVDADVKSIYDTKSYLGEYTLGSGLNNVDTINAIFRKYNTVYELAQLFEAFSVYMQQNYKDASDLTTFLWSFLNNDQMATLSGIIDLPHKPDFKYLNKKLVTA